ncbi:MAG: TerB family tellurite resistance protein [Rhizobiales bacterium]|nr:TerB family tellurite resistance protein [Hyphomicrobiales bacterium]
MLQAFKQFLSDLAVGEKDPNRFEDNDYRLAAAALLIHAAVIDGEMSETERDRLIDVIRLRFNLDEAAADELVTEATTAEQQAVDLYRFTSRLDRMLDEGGRQQIIEMMWQVAYADGRVSEFEDNLIWRAADLLHVPSEARIALRRRVAESSTVASGNE